ncbi:MAG: hypothetical protein PVF73_03840, partial [Bacteroidales bacterium]
MKMIRFTLITLALLFACNTFAQKIKVASGDINNLKGINQLNIEFDYSDLAVGDFDNEEDYIAKRVAEINEKEAGAGDSWKVKWFDDREYRYEPKFKELFSKYADHIESGEDIDAEVTMNAHTIFIEPGFNVGVARRPAMINMKVTFSKGDEELVVIAIDKCPGGDAMGFDYDTGGRIAEAYAKAGKSLAKYM